MSLDCGFDQYIDTPINGTPHPIVIIMLAKLSFIWHMLPFQRITKATQVGLYIKQARQKLHLLTRTNICSNTNKFTVKSSESKNYVRLLQTTGTNIYIQ